MTDTCITDKYDEIGESSKNILKHFQKQRIRINFYSRFCMNQLVSLKREFSELVAEVSPYHLYGSALASTSLLGISPLSLRAL